MTRENRAMQREVSKKRRRGDYSIGINAALPRFEEGPDSDKERSPKEADEDDAYTDERTASRGIRALRKLRGQSRPWFLALGFVRPHLPFNAPSRFWQSARDAGALGAAGGEAYAPSGLSHLTTTHLTGGDGELYDFNGPKHVVASSTHGKTLAIGYAAAVSFADAQVGRVLNSLHSTGGDNTTLVVLLSDHGWKLGHYGGWGKHTLLSADTHTPLMIRYTGFAPKRVHAPVELIDVYPTLCELARLSCGTGGGTSRRRRAKGEEEEETEDDNDEEGRRLGRRRARNKRRKDASSSSAAATTSAAAESSSPALEGRSLVPLMHRPSPRAAVARSAAFSQWPLRKRSVRCMGYAVRTQGWLYVQWAADLDSKKAATADVKISGDACEEHSDLFKVDRNSSRVGVLREAPVAKGHARVRRVLRRRLWKVVRS